MPTDRKGTTASLRVRCGVCLSAETNKLSKRISNGQAEVHITQAAYASNDGIRGSVSGSIPDISLIFVRQLRTEIRERADVASPDRWVRLRSDIWSAF